MSDSPASPAAAAGRPSPPTPSCPPGSTSAVPAWSRSARARSSTARACGPRWPRSRPRNSTWTCGASGSPRCPPPPAPTRASPRAAAPSRTPARRCARRARRPAHLFLAAAADRLGAGAGALGVTDGEITTDAGGTGLTYWSLAGQAGPAAPGLLDREAGDPGRPRRPRGGRSPGRSAARLDIPDKVTGRPRFLHDLVLPGMLYGRVIRPPAPAASLAGLGDPPLPGDVVTGPRRLLPRGGGAVRTGPRSRRRGRLARAARWEVTAVPARRAMT